MTTAAPPQRYDTPAPSDSDAQAISLEEAATRVSTAVDTYHHDMNPDGVRTLLRALQERRRQGHGTSLYFILDDLARWQRNGRVWERADGTEARFETSPRQAGVVRVADAYGPTTLAKSLDEIAADEVLHDGFHFTNGVITRAGAKFNLRRSLNAYDWSAYDQALRDGRISSGNGHTIAYRVAADTGCVTVADGQRPYPAIMIPAGRGADVYSLDTTE